KRHPNRQVCVTTLRPRAAHLRTCTELARATYDPTVHLSTFHSSRRNVLGLMPWIFLFAATDVRSWNRKFQPAPSATMFCIWAYRSFRAACEQPGSVRACSIALSSSGVLKPLRLKPSLPRWVRLARGMPQVVVVRVGAEHEARDEHVELELVDAIDH